MSVIGIYHKSCNDGTAAAAVLLRKYSDAKLFPLGHAATQEEIDAVVAEVNEGDLVYTLDCAIGVRELLAAGHTVTTIDHHIGIADEMRTLADGDARFTFIFDTEKSGATLAWDYFFPEEDMPELIKYVEDADIWNWTYGEDTQYVTGYLSMFRDEPQTFLDFFAKDIANIKEKGQTIATYTEIEVAEQTKREPVYIHIGEHVVPAFNITTQKSACGNILSETYDAAVAIYTISGEDVKISFRGLEQHVPTALTLAQILDGNGHKNAAGARVSLSDFISMLQQR